MSGASFHLVFGWSCAGAGAVSGAWLGLFFHREGWAGGYGSLRRRMLRLGHIAFFGLGILNVLYGLTLSRIHAPPPLAALGTAGFVLGAVTMPLCCFLTAWKSGFRRLFPIPVASVLAGVVSAALAALPR